MASSQKPWKADYAKSGRSSCKTCNLSIDKENLRLGKMVHATQFDGFMPRWNHANCILKKVEQIKAIDDVEGLESLRLEDQQKIRKYLEGAGSTNSSANENPFTDTECGIEVSQTSRATCRHCSQKIVKGEVRISTKPESQGARSLAWHHAKCFMELTPSNQMEKFSGWESLSASDRETVCAMIKKVPSTVKSGTKIEGQEDKEFRQQSTSKAGAKRKKKVSGDQKSKVSKAEGDVSTGRAASARNAID